jgi:hypothetical protein
MVTATSENLDTVHNSKFKKFRMLDLRPSSGVAVKVSNLLNVTQLEGIPPSKRPTTRGLPFSYFA